MFREPRGEGDRSSDTGFTGNEVRSDQNKLLEVQKDGTADCCSIDMNARKIAHWESEEL